jgi:hypothetical protein
MRTPSLSSTFSFLLLSANCLFAEGPAAPGEGLLFGLVGDAKTGRPLAECRVRLLPADTAVFTDSSGTFSLGGLQPGIYRALFIKAGYEAFEQGNVVVGTGRAEEVQARLQPLEGTVELAEKSARGKARPALGSGNDAAGAFRYGRNDVLRAPGALGDISMFAQGLPGVGRVDDQSTELSVRGGGPDENAFLVDGIPIFNINHFENNSKAGGGIGNINTYFLDGVEFQTGAFSARYPDRLSSVMDITFKRGNPRQTSGMLTADVAGMGGLLEGPVPGSDGNGTYGATFRMSALTLLDKAGIIDFGAIPRYANTHVKVNRKAGPWDIGFNLLGGADGYDAREPNGILPLSQKDSTPYRADYVEVLLTYNLFGGLRATRDLDRARLSLYGAANTRQYEYREGFDRDLAAPAPGHPTAIETRGGETSGGNRVLWGADYDFFLSPRWTLRTGLLHEYEMPEKTEWSRFDLAFADRDSAGKTRETRSSSWYTAGAYGEARYASGPWDLAGGLRVFYDEYTGKAFPGPRASLRRKLGAHTLKAAAGLHTQSQAGPAFGNRRPPDEGELPWNAQGILGWDAELPYGLMARLEAFDKEGFRLLRFRPDGTARDTGRTYSRGVDLFLRKALKRKAWGTASYTFAWNRERRAGEWRRSAYSVPHAFTGALGYDFSRAFTASVRLGMASGSPYTSLAAFQEGMVPGAIDPTLRFRSRTDPYFRLDTRAEWRKPFRAATLGVFLEITNLTDEPNLFGKDEFDLEEGWGFLPIGGLTLSF